MSVLAVSRPAAASVRSALGAAVLGFFVITLDAVVVTVALPSVRADLGGGVSGLQWVVDGYTLMFAALLLSAGSLTDRIGARHAFGGGLVLFILASVGCGLAPGLGALVAARFVQGSAAAVMMPSSMALIRQAYPDSAARAQALSVWAMGGAVASSAGPLLGGVLSEFDWRLIFALNVPVGVVALWLVARTPAVPGQAVPFDRVGQVTAVLTMGGLTYGAIEAGAAGPTAPVVAAFGIAVLALAGFVISQARVAHPMVPPDLFRSRNVAVLLGIGFAFMAGYWGLPFVVSLYVQQLRGLSAVATGALFVPMMLVGAALTPFSARLAERAGRRTVIVAGLLSMTAGLAIVGMLPDSAPPWILAALMILVGLGGPLVMPTAMAVLLDSVPAHRAGTVSGVFNTGRQVGGALAVAVFGGLLADPDHVLRGVHASLLIAAAVVAIAAAATLLLRTKESS